MKLQKFSKILIVAVVILFLFVEFYLWKIYPEDISLSGYLSGLYATILTGETKKAIKIDLKNYDITLWEGDELLQSHKISGAGNPKFSPTPRGKFRILSKEKLHISSINGVAMPWSLRFYKGYYLHGFPYFPNTGQPVTTKYSFGCIRLPEKIDQEIYNWVEIGTKVEIY